MSKEPNSIDRLVREKLDGFEMTPPPSVWTDTSAALKGRRKKRFILWFFSGAILVTMLTFGLSYFISGESSELKSNNDELSQNDATSTQEKSTKDGEDQAPKSVNGQNSETENDSTFIGDVHFSKNHLNQLKNKSTSTASGSGAQGRSISGIGQKKDKSGTFLSLGSGFHGTDLDSMDGLIDPLITGFGSGSQQKDPFSESVEQTESDIEKNIALNNLFKFDHVSALQFLPLTPFGTPQVEPVIKRYDEDAIPPIVPFWKSISVEGSFGISTFSNRPVKKTADSSFISLLSNASANQMSFDLRFGLNYHFTDRVSFQSGVHYNQAKEDYTYTASETSTYSYIDTLSFSVDTSTMDTTYITGIVFYDSTSLATNKVQNTYKLITIPFQFGWSQPISVRGSLEFTAGGELSIYGRNTGYVIFSDNNEVLPAEGAYHTSGMLSVGGSVKYLHKFGDHHSVYVEPWAQFGVTNQFSQQLNYESRRYRFGIRFGYRFYL